MNKNMTVARQPVMDQVSSMFEGTEKKLEIEFVQFCTRRPDQRSSHQPQFRQSYRKLPEEDRSLDDPKRSVNLGCNCSLEQMSSTTDQEISESVGGRHGSWIDHSTKGSLRNMSVAAIEEFLSLSGCTILSRKSNADFDAFLLSESSLFVYPRKIVMKTCGTTTPLCALELILMRASEFALAPYTVHYSHARYMFPENQLHPHNSFAAEAAFLDRVFDPYGNHQTLRTAKSSMAWHIYRAEIPLSFSLEILRNQGHFTTAHSKNVNLEAPDDKDQRDPVGSAWSGDGAHDLGDAPCSCKRDSMSKRDHNEVSLTAEIFMYDLDRTVMNKFVHISPSFSLAAGLGKADTDEVEKLVPEESVIDSYQFAPCGYSLNALLGKHYYTIHITPELHCSYVSFETNDEAWLSSSAVAEIISFLRPSKFAVGLIVDQNKTDFCEKDCSDSDCTDEEGGKCTLAPHLAQYQKMLSAIPVHAQMSTCDVAHLTGQCYALFFSFNQLWVGELGAKVPACMRISDIDSEDTSDGETGSDLAGLEPLKQDALLVDFIKKLEAEEGCSVVRSVDEAVEKYSGEVPCLIFDLSLLVRSISYAQYTFRGARLQYAVRCNLDERILSILDQQGIHFSVANVADLGSLERLRVDRAKITFVSPFVPRCLVSESQRVSTFLLHPGSRLLHLLSADEAHWKPRAQISIGVGPTSFHESLEAARRTLNSGFNVSSFFLECHAFDPGGERAYHAHKANSVSSRYFDTSSEFDAIERDAKLLRGLSKSFRTIRQVMEAEPRIPRDACVLIGEHYPGGSEGTARDFGRVRDLAGNLNIAVDVSRFLVGPIMTVVTTVVARRPCADSGAFFYYLNDGVYGALSAALIEGKVYRPRLHSNCEPAEARGTHQCTMFGPTCDSMDRVWEGEFPRLQIGDIVLWEQAGDYTSSQCSTFNGFGMAFKTCYISHSA